MALWRAPDAPHDTGGVGASSPVLWTRTTYRGLRYRHLRRYLVQVVAVLPGIRRLEDVPFGMPVRTEADLRLFGPLEPDDLVEVAPFITGRPSPVTYHVPARHLAALFPHHHGDHP